MVLLACKVSGQNDNVATYNYMPNGLRLSKTVNGAKTSFLWNGDDQMFMEVTSSEIRNYTKLYGYMSTGINKIMSEQIDN